jgi:hypothetical protein
MSMIAKFVEVAPDHLVEILEEPDSVIELFHKPAMGARTAPTAMNERMRAEAMRRAPQMLAESLARMNPSIRGALATNLKAMGIDIADLQTGKGGDALLKLMIERMGPLSTLLGASGGSGGTAGGATGTAGPELSLDKAWHGVHYLLTGLVEPDTTPLSQVIMGGTEIGDDDLGYGPARYFAPTDVVTAATELGATTLEAQMQSRFDPARMTTLGIYPGGWTSTGLAWLMDEYRNLRGFFADASKHQAAVITCLV